MGLSAGCSPTDRSQVYLVHNPSEGRGVGITSLPPLLPFQSLKQAESAVPASHADAESLRPTMGLKSSSSGDRRDKT